MKLAGVDFFSQQGWELGKGKVKLVWSQENSGLKESLPGKIAWGSSFIMSSSFFHLLFM